MVFSDVCFAPPSLVQPAEHVNCSIDMFLFSFSLSSRRREGPTILPKLHEGSIASCHMSADAKLLVTGGYDLRVILWDLESMTHKLVLRVRRVRVHLTLSLSIGHVGTSRLD